MFFNIPRTYIRLLCILLHFALILKRMQFNCRMFICMCDISKMTIWRTISFGYNGWNALGYNVIYLFGTAWYTFFKKLWRRKGTKSMKHHQTNEIFFYYVARCVLIRHELLCKSPTTLYRKSKRNYRKYCFRQSLLLTTKQQKSLLGGIKQSSLLPAHFSIWKETQTIGFNKFDLSSFLSSKT